MKPPVASLPDWASRSDLGDTELSMWSRTQSFGLLKASHHRPAMGVPPGPLMLQVHNSPMQGYLRMDSQATRRAVRRDLAPRQKLIVSSQPGRHLGA